MDYYQGVVIDFLRATRTRFVNTECLIQLVPGDVPEKGLHWYCDAVTIDLQRTAPTVHLCEISYSKTLGALLKRLDAWRAHWIEIRDALARDCAIDGAWSVQPWIFVPHERKSLLDRKLPAEAPKNPLEMPKPRVTWLEDVVPWNYRDWNGKPYSASEKFALRNE
jgi:hypothetical protein